MKLVTWNVNSLKQRLPRILEFLDEHQPDIACLQETKTLPEAFPDEELAAAGYHAVHHSGGRWAGVAILARGAAPTAVTAGLPGEVVQDECRWLEATVGDLRVVSVYVPNGRSLDSPSFAEKLVFLESMARRVAELRDRPLVVAGDFNVCPADIDVYDPPAFVGSTHTSDAERERLAAILDAGDLVDCFRHLHPDEVGFTWWDYRAGHFHKKLGLRIDLVLATGDLAGGLAHCGIDRTYRKGPKPSDHAPLLAAFS